MATVDCQRLERDLELAKLETAFWESCQAVRASSAALHKIHGFLMEEMLELESDKRRSLSRRVEAMELAVAEMKVAWEEEVRQLRTELEASVKAQHVPPSASHAPTPPPLPSAAVIQPPQVVTGPIPFIPEPELAEVSDMRADTTSADEEGVELGGVVTAQPMAAVELEAAQNLDKPGPSMSQVKTGWPTDLPELQPSVIGEKVREALATAGDVGHSHITEDSDDDLVLAREVTVFATAGDMADRSPSPELMLLQRGRGRGRSSRGRGRGAPRGRPRRSRGRGRKRPLSERDSSFVESEDSDGVMMGEVGISDEERGGGQVQRSRGRGRNRGQQRARANVSRDVSQPVSDDDSRITIGQVEDSHQKLSERGGGRGRLRKESMTTEVEESLAESNAESEDESVVEAMKERSVREWGQRERRRSRGRGQGTGRRGRGRTRATGSRRQSQRVNDGESGGVTVGEIATSDDEGSARGRKRRYVSRDKSTMESDSGGATLGETRESGKEGRADKARGQGRKRGRPRKVPLLERDAGDGTSEIVGELDQPRPTVSSSSEEAQVAVTPSRGHGDSNRHMQSRGRRRRSIQDTPSDLGKSVVATVPSVDGTASEQPGPNSVVLGQTVERQSSEVAGLQTSSLEMMELAGESVIQALRLDAISDAGRPERETAISEAGRPERETAISDTGRPERDTISDAGRLETETAISDAGRPEIKTAISEAPRPERETAILEATRPQTAKHTVFSEATRPEREKDTSISEAPQPERDTAISEAGRPQTERDTEAESGSREAGSGERANPLGQEVTGREKMEAGETNRRDKHDKSEEKIGSDEQGPGSGLNKTPGAEEEARDEHARADKGQGSGEEEQRRSSVAGGRLLERIVESLVERSHTTAEGEGATRGRGRGRGGKRRTLTARKPAQQLTLPEMEEVSGGKVRALLVSTVGLSAPKLKTAAVAPSVSSDMPNN